MQPTASEIIQRLRAARLAPPLSATVAITNQCNLRCHHCWPNSGPEEEASMVAEDRVMSVIDGFSALGAETLTITGGEPLTHPGWMALLRFACSRPQIDEVRLQTNAILIEPWHLEFFSSLKDQGLTLQTSLEGATPAAHDRVRGPGSFARTLNGLRLLQKSGLAPLVRIAFTEMRHNFAELPDLLQMVDEMGVRRFVTGTLVIGGRAQGSNTLGPPTPGQYEALLDRFQQDRAFRERYRRIGNIAALEWALDTSDTTETCCTFMEMPYVNAKGRLYPCVLMHVDEYAATDVYARPLFQAIGEMIDRWARLQRISRDRLTQLTACKECTGFARCAGGCMGRAYAAHRDFITVEDRCSLRKAVYGKGLVQGGGNGKHHDFGSGETRQ